MAGEFFVANPELGELAGKVGGAFYTPGSAGATAARLAQNRADLVGTPINPPAPRPVTAPAALPQATYSNEGRSVPALGANPVAMQPETGVRAVTMPNGQKLFTNVDGNANAIAGLNNPTTVNSVPSLAPASITPAGAHPAAMNPALMNTQRQILDAIGAAQDVVAQGSNREGYKMGDVTKSLMTMQNLNPALNSINGLIGQTYGADVSAANNALDNTTRSNIAQAANVADLVKTDMVGQYGVHRATQDAAANVALAQLKAQLDAASPQGQKVAAENKALSTLTPQQLLGVLHPDTYKPVVNSGGTVVGKISERSGTIAGLTPAELAAIDATTATQAEQAKARKK